jgi:hypothetical protein
VTIITKGGNRMSSRRILCGAALALAGFAGIGAAAPAVHWPKPVTRAAAHAKRVGYAQAVMRAVDAYDHQAAVALQSAWSSEHRGYTAPVAAWQRVYAPLLNGSVSLTGWQRAGSVFPGTGREADRVLSWHDAVYKATVAMSGQAAAGYYLPGDRARGARLAAQITPNLARADAAARELAGSR